MVEQDSLKILIRVQISVETFNYKSRRKVKMKKPTKKDYQLSVGIFGRYLKDLPKPHIMLYPNSYKKRRVVISESTWVGSYAINAVHYYSRIEFEGNGFWDGKSWVRPWDYYENDPDPDDMRFPPSFQSKKPGLAVQKAEKWLKKNFNMADFELELRYLDLPNGPKPE